MDRIYITKGEKVFYRGIAAIIVRIVNINTVTIEEVETNIPHTVPVSLLSSKLLESVTSHDIINISDKDWEKAKKRHGIIKPILHNSRTVEDVKLVAKNNNISTATLYRWLKRYNETGLVSSLLGQKKNGGIGKSRLLKVQDDIINNKIHSVYLNKSRKSINKTIRAIQMECQELGVKYPHPNTIRNRIKNISEETKIRTRMGIQEAKYKFEPLKGSFPGADYPLTVVQIDHTLVDIILVDEHTRQAYKRPWITVAIDVYSRVVLGFYLSFESPGALGTGICIANAILPKEIWMERVGVNSEWPCWGVMDTIHTDNAKEFRGNMLKKACMEYGISIEFRPIGETHYGGHIERLLGTFSKEIHDLPGTTFSNPQERKKYDSAKNASFTLKEFEKWITIYITKIYHKRDHSSILMTPLKKYEQGVLGTSENLGRGISPRINNERKVRLDFLPYVERTVQEYGVRINHISYYNDVLRNYIHDMEKGRKKKHVFKIDPRDISVIYFYEPTTKQYYDITYGNTSLPPMSIWEYRDVLKELKKKNQEINEDHIFEAYRELEEIEYKAIRKRNFRKVSPKLRLKKEDRKVENVELDIDDIKPFEELDDEAFRQ